VPVRTWGTSLEMDPGNPNTRFRVWDSMESICFTRMFLRDLHIGAAYLLDARNHDLYIYIYIYIYIYVCVCVCVCVCVLAILSSSSKYDLA